MRFDLFGGNYFHALSRSDLLKGWTTITLQSFSLLFCYVLFCFFFLVFSLDSSSLLYFSHRGTEVQGRKQQTDLPLLLKRFQTKVLMVQRCTEMIKATHVARYQNLYPNWTLVYIHCHTRKEKKTLIVTGELFLWTNTACSTFYTEEPSTLFTHRQQQ